jgi:hypothetical protein
VYEEAKARPTYLIDRCVDCSPLRGTEGDAAQHTSLRAPS